MNACCTVLTLALWQSIAGAQVPVSAEELLDRYTATGDHALLERCRTAAAKLPPGNRAKLLEARLLLASGDAKHALHTASELNRTIPDELDPYGVMVDAALALGDIATAEQQAEWMLRLRPDDVRSLVRGAAVREAIGDNEGAAQMFVDAFTRTSRADVGPRADIGVRLARVTWKRGNQSDALRLLTQVEGAVPGYAPAAAFRREMEKTQ